MRMVSWRGGVALAAMVCLWHGAAQAQTPRQIQGMIENGQSQTALAALQPVTAAHPDSGIAWYLTAEAQDASGNEAAARAALSKAEQYAPGLPFAKSDQVAALQTHIGSAAAGGRAGGSHIILWLVILGGLFLVFRMFARSRRRFAPNGYAQPGYGPQGAPGGPFGMGGGGGGMGSSLLGGLVAGAGFAAGERVIGDMFGGGQNGGQMIDPANGQDFSSGRDDGLLGSPDWNDNNQNDGGNFDPGNNW